MPPPAARAAQGGRGRAHTVAPQRPGRGRGGGRGGAPAGGLRHRRHPAGERWQLHLLIRQDPTRDPPSLGWSDDHADSAEVSMPHARLQSCCSPWSIRSTSPRPSASTGPRRRSIPSLLVDGVHARTARGAHDDPHRLPDLLRPGSSPPSEQVAHQGGGLWRSRGSASGSPHPKHPVAGQAHRRAGEGQIDGQDPAPIASHHLQGRWPRRSRFARPGRPRRTTLEALL